ncbi:MAG TPA: hypothetical protein VE615_04280 [Gaiellaceae bacterium]|nr:hypothetical protein [Gaiellaceae bacterium]
MAVSQRQALGALFLLLAAVFAGVAFTAFSAEFDVVVWGIGAAAGAMALWLLGLSFRALRHRAR